MTDSSRPQQRRPKAYSYLRFSTLDQKGGDSYRRQWEAAKQYAAAHNLDLDEELKFHDIGVSGFRGVNAERGKLAAFRRAVEDGIVVPGSYLLVEDFDRLSRMGPWEALPIFQEIVNSGTVVVTLKDGRVWHKEGLRENPLQIIESLLAMWNGHNESIKKSQRLAAVFEAKRAALAAGETTAKPYKHGPAWVSWDYEERVFKLNDHAPVVQDIFRRAAAGAGLDGIARALNKEGVPTFSKGKQTAQYWRGSYVRKIILSTAAIGKLTMHRSEQDEATRARRDRVVGTIDNYFPAVVERELFEKVSALTAAKAPRGRNAQRDIAHIFAGAIRCARCGGTVIRIQKSKTRPNPASYVYLVCARAHSKGGCERLAVPYPDVEAAFVRSIDALVDAAPLGQGTHEIEQEMVSLGERAAELASDRDAYLEALRTSRSPTVMREMRETETTLQRIQDQIRALQERRERIGQPYVLKRLAGLRDALKETPLDISKANRAVKTAVDRLVLDPAHGKLWVQWRDQEGATDYVLVPSKHWRPFEN